MPLPAQRRRPVQAFVKMKPASDLSLRGGQRPTWQSRGGTSDSYRPSIKRYAPIASVAALTERLVQRHSTAGGHWCTTALPDVSLRGAKRRGNLTVQCRITGNFRRKRDRSQEIAPQGHFLALRAQGATAPLGPRNDKSGSAALTMVPCTEWAVLMPLRGRARHASPLHLAFNASAMLRG